MRWVKFGKIPCTVRVLILVDFQVMATLFTSPTQKFCRVTDSVDELVIHTKKTWRKDQA